MIGQLVEHPAFGAGQIVAVYRNGTEWLVRFDNGLRFRRPCTEFGAESQTAVAASPTAPVYTPPAPMSTSQRAARHLIEALRVGIAPAEHIADLTVNLKAEQASLTQALHDAHQQGGAVRAIVGEYGFGKSHMVELATREALQHNFLVATVSLDLQELPPHRPFAVYQEAMRHVRYPDTDERGLRPLLEKTATHPTTVAHLHQNARVANDPLTVAVQAITNTASSRQRGAWATWLMGGKRTTNLNKGVPAGVKFPSIYTVGHNMRQIAYLFTAVSALARLNNYNGLCLLVDEAESYALLPSPKRPKAALFFQAMVYAAQPNQPTKIKESQFPQHRWCTYPVAYEQGQAFFFLFTATYSDNRLPLADWLTAEQIITLSPAADPQEIGQLLHHILTYHAQAYAYEPQERHAQIRRGAAELLAQGLRHGRLSMRSTIRLIIELYDLLYLHPTYDVALMLDELRTQTRG